MKRTVLFLTLWMLTFVFGCTTYEKLTDREQEFKTFGFTFEEYAEKGFLFLPTVYTGDYVLVGDITVELHPEVKHEPGGTRSRDGYDLITFYKGSETWTKFISKITPDDLFEYVYNMSVELGGDGFVNYKIVTKTDQAIANNPASAYDYTVISGWIIKRK